MHWVLSKNLKSDGQYETLLKQLARQDTPYTLIGTVPFSGEVIEVEGDLKLADITGPVFGCGKGSMKIVTNQYGWTPGYIDAADYVEAMLGYGDHLLNSKCTWGNLSVLHPPRGRFFVRPIEDDKSFNGQIMDHASFLDWQRTMCAMEDSATVTKDTGIVIAPLREIYAEYRFYVVNGEVVTGSLYKSRDTVIYKECIDEGVIDFAREMVKLYNPSIAYVIDIADTPKGLRVLETNSISSSGFYAIDIGKFVNAINGLGEGSV